MNVTITTWVKLLFNARNVYAKISKLNTQKVSHVNAIFFNHSFLKYSFILIVKHIRDSRLDILW